MKKIIPIIMSICLFFIPLSMWFVLPQVKHFRWTEDRILLIALLHVMGLFGSYLIYIHIVLDQKYIHKVVDAGGRILCESYNFNEAYYIAELSGGLMVYSEPIN